MLWVPFSPRSAIRSFSTQVSADDVAGIIASDGSRLVLMDFDGNATEIGVTTWPKGVDATTGLVSGFPEPTLSLRPGERRNLGRRWAGQRSLSLAVGFRAATADRARSVSEINGAIHVIYPDGRIVSMSSGEVYNRMELGTDQQRLRSAGGRFRRRVGQSLSRHPGGRQHLAGGMSIWVTAASTQILLPPDTIDGMTVEDIFDDVSSMVVSEARGQIYWIADGAIWSATLPEHPKRKKPIDRIARCQHGSWSNGQWQWAMETSTGCRLRVNSDDFRFPLTRVYCLCPLPTSPTSRRTACSSR